MSVGVLPHEQPVFSATNPHSRVQIATFEFAVKIDVLASVVAVSSATELRKTQLYLQGAVPFMVLK